MFKGIIVEKDAEGYRSSMANIDEARLPDGDVTVRVEYSTLNFKDGLAITGKGPVVRNFPMVPGIDFAGFVEKSNNPEFQVGDRVLLNGWGVGESHWGGLAQRARIKGEWLIPIPQRFSTKQAMAIGTAGYTAMLCVLALEGHGLKVDHGPVLVTGASGGVGSFAVALLAKLGYHVTASTGRSKEATYLKRLGARDVIDRNEFSAAAKPLQKERWAAAVDSVGSHTLANVCAQIQYGGVVAACGMAQGLDFPGSVAPFILRGVTLLGIDSVMRPKADRLAAWERLAIDLQGPILDDIAEEIPLEQAIGAASKLMNGQVRGRLIVNLNA